MTLQQYVDFAWLRPKLRCELAIDGTVAILPHLDGESSWRNGEVLGQIGNWTRTNGRGVAFASNCQFILPDGSARMADASWVSHESLHRLSRAARREFLRLTPEFIIEVMSPSDRLKVAKAKMQSWIANGVELGWLIDGDHETVHVYRKRRNPVVRRGIQQLAGEGSVKGFVLDLRPIWQGLR